MRLGSSSINDPLIGVSNDYAELCDLGKSTQIKRIQNVNKNTKKISRLQLFRIIFNNLSVETLDTFGFIIKWTTQCSFNL